MGAYTRPCCPVLIYGTLHQYSKNGTYTRLNQDGRRHRPKNPTHLNDRQIQLATWNIDAFGPDLDARLNGIFTTLQNLETGSPDIIFLQEVSLNALDFLLSHPWIRAHYISSEADGTN